MTAAKVGDTVMIDKLMPTIAEVTDAVVTMDANHPLAGHPLTFEVPCWRSLE